MKIVFSSEHGPGRAAKAARSGACAWVLLFLMAGGAAADEDIADVAGPVEAVATDTLVLDAAVIREDQLDSERAKAYIEVDRVVINDQELNGTVSNNSAINTVSGDNNISGTAFESTSGFVNSVQNTGNNVLIQNATIVNIEVTP